MIRKIALSTILIAALAVAGFAPSASAQTPEPTATPCSYANYIAYNCVGQAGGYPNNGFKPRPTPTPRPTPKPTSSAVVSADTVEATTVSGSNNAIAFTGSESRTLGFVGAGMIGFGAIALAVARRRGDDLEAGTN